MLGHLKTLLFSLFLLFSFSAFSQEKKEVQDSLVRLLEANSAQLLEIEGISYRKVTGPARFFHNNTYLLCDTALWNVNTNIIHAIGHVQIIQENTFLSSDKIDYIVDENLAQFRGHLVELFDKDGNILRTNHLDYNTKDSIATFMGGGAMKNKEGSLIESREGTYRAKEKIFSFEKEVQMFTDSAFIKSDKIDYNTEQNKAYFGTGTTAWQEENMLFANDGEFDRPNNIFHFKKDSYILTKDQEVWTDTLHYFRNTGVARLYNNIQVLDTVQSVFCFADKAVYQPDPMSVTLTEKPSAAVYTFENGVRDTTFLAADTLRYYTIRYCDIDTNVIVLAKERKKLSDMDPLIEIEKESLAKRNRSHSPLPGNPMAPLSTEGPLKNNEITKEVSLSETPMDSRAVQSVAGDSLSMAGDSILVKQDSLAVSADTTVVPVKDTTAIAFMDAWHHVRIYKNDMQALCDSLVYTGMDSIARFYTDPVMWSENKHQFTADSMQVVIKDNVLNKANLISNAFIASQEDTIHYNQIKGTEMVAYFKDNDVYRFDALGGASMIFYLQEDSVITMMNQKEGKMLSARLKDKKIQRIKYIENLKNDALPIYNLPLENQRLRGFHWRGEERPVNRFEVSDRKIRPSRRKFFTMAAFPDYPNAALYFAAFRDSIMAYKVKSDSIRIARELMREKEQQERKLEELRRTDSLVSADSLLRIDSLINIGIADSLSLQDSLKNIPDEKINPEVLSKRQLARMKKQEARLKKQQAREEKRAAKIKRKEAIRQERLEKKQKRMTN